MDLLHNVHVSLLYVDNACLASNLQAHIIVFVISNGVKISIKTQDFVFTVKWQWEIFWSCLQL